MKGTVWKFGDDIDTDIILPGRYLIYTDEEKVIYIFLDKIFIDKKSYF